MFWAVTCEAQKRYCQVPAEPYHVSMASLEPREMAPDNRQVSLMVEHRGKEFLLCTLEYDRIMQVPLDLKFNKGEETYFFVNGDGTVHLSGYLLSKDSDIEAAFYAQQLMEAQMRSKEQYNKDYGTALDTTRLLTVDSADEDSGEDYSPKNVTPVICSKPILRSDKHVSFVGALDVDSDCLPTDEEEESLDDEESSEEDDEEEESSGDDVKVIVSSDSDNMKVAGDGKVFNNGEVQSKKRKKLNVPAQQLAKKQKNLDDVAGDEEAPKLVDPERKKKKKKKNKVPVQVKPASDSDSSEVDEANSSIGRTPMPRKKMNFSQMSNDTMNDGRPSLGADSFTGVALSSKSKKTALKLKTSTPHSEQKFSKRLPSGIEYVDLKVGDGPMAKKGKFAHVYYVGKCNNQVFDSRMKGLPFSFRLGSEEVIKGWDLGIEGMKVNGKRTLKIPPHLAYGKKGSPPVIPPQSTLDFTIQLLKVS